MQRKICAIGNSRGVSLPPDLLEKLHLAVGSEVNIELDDAQAKIIIEPVKKKKYPKGIDQKFVSQVNDFIERYRPALDELAKK
ncbi:MAG: AbrB/MazE/SpoVT family DNA-binding domain-containing protein [Nitrospirae bacterium]|nr:AbrB/MazE/SpoVT family DNA-binding domain-containing protein [Nitrospirota bacterium]